MNYKPLPFVGELMLRVFFLFLFLSHHNNLSQILKYKAHYDN